MNDSDQFLVCVYLYIFVFVYYSIHPFFFIRPDSLEENENEQEVFRRCGFLSSFFIGWPTLCVLQGNGI